MKRTRARKDTRREPAVPHPDAPRGSPPAAPGASRGSLWGCPGKQRPAHPRSPQRPGLWHRAPRDDRKQPGLGIPAGGPWQHGPGHQFGDGMHQLAVLQRAPRLVRVLLGAITVWLQNAGWTVALHLAGAWLLVGAVTVTAVGVWWAPTASAPDGPARRTAPAEIGRAHV